MRRKTRKQRGGGGAEGENGAGNGAGNRAGSNEEGNNGTGSNGEGNNREGNNRGGNAETYTRNARGRRGSLITKIRLGATTPVVKPWSLLNYLFPASVSSVPSVKPNKQSEPEPTIEEEIQRLNDSIAEKNPNESLLIVNDAERESIEDVRRRSLILIGLTREEKKMLDFIRKSGLTIQNLASCELAIREGRIPPMVIQPLSLSPAGARSLRYKLPTNARHSSYRE